MKAAEADTVRLLAFNRVKLHNNPALLCLCNNLHSGLSEKRSRY